MNACGLLHRVDFRGLLGRLYRIEVVGAERVPASGPAIHYMAKAELFRLRARRTRIRIEVGAPIAVAASRPTIGAARALTELLQQAVTAA